MLACSLLNMVLYLLQYGNDRCQRAAAAGVVKKLSNDYIDRDEK